MKRLICISKGCFWNPHEREDVNRYIRQASKLDIDGIEFLIGDALDLLTFRLKKSSIKILKNLKFNTIHAPFHLDKEILFFSNNKRSKRILKKLHEIYDKMNAVNINIHPQQIEDFRVFDMKNYNYSIENMEMHHEFKIKDYKKFLKKGFKLVLDTTHASEANELNKLLKIFKKKIVYTHLSANYFNHLHIPLHVLKEEYLKPLNIIKKGNFPIVLESQIGTEDIREYKKEVEFVRKWLNS
ncbi:hypothetical protein KY343_00275 [Candidatus Woesearchaeota archaeon]|nr:hypothetical protein [Candidatus Woesearchaeota archaeon]